MFAAVYVDGTDHISLVCPKCKRVIAITSVETEECQDGEKCTYIHGKCPQCEKTSLRKFYWENITPPKHVISVEASHGNVIGLHND